SKDTTGLGSVSQQRWNLSRPLVPVLANDKIVPIQIDQRERILQKVANRVRVFSGDDEIVRLVMLDDAPDRFHIVTGKSPVAFGVQVAQSKRLHFAGHNEEHTSELQSPYDLVC